MFTIVYKMIDRLKKIIDYYNLSASSFADIIDVPRSSISHLLSGRNKPSLDFVIKVEKAFDEIELNWLVYGEGSFPKKIISQTNEELIKKDTPSLFPENEVSEQIPEKKSNTRFSESSQNKEESAHFSEIKNIVVLYEDGTFKDYNKR